MTLPQTVQEIVDGLNGDIRILESRVYGSFDNGWVSFGEGDVVWRLIRERAVLSLVASPAFEQTLWLDHDLLWRFVYGQPAPTRSFERDDVALEVAAVIRSLRDGVREAFRAESWPEVRERMMIIGRQRDAESLGRPLPKRTSADHT